MKDTLEQIRKHLLVVMTEAHKGRTESTNQKHLEILKQISSAAENLGLQIEQLLKQR